ncbi:uncharacterized protein METZ01_LOCUS76920, partial [marine metagenome]
MVSLIAAYNQETLAESYDKFKKNSEITFFPRTIVTGWWG